MENKTKLLEPKLSQFRESIISYRDTSFKKLSESLKTTKSLDRLSHAIVKASENLRSPLTLIGIAAILGAVLFGGAALIKAIVVWQKYQRRTRREKKNVDNSEGANDTNVIDTEEDDEDDC